MALSLLAAAMLLSGASVSARSIDEICSIIENNRGVSTSVQEFVSCGMGGCSKDDEDTGACPAGESKISFKVKLNGRTRCTERCMAVSGGDGASTSGDDDADDEPADDVAGGDEDAEDDEIAAEPDMGDSDDGMDDAADDDDDGADDSAMGEDVDADADADDDTADDADDDDDTDVAVADDTDAAVVVDADGDDDADAVVVVPDALGGADADDMEMMDDNMMPVAADAMIDGGMAGAPGMAMAPADGPAGDDEECDDLVDALMAIPEAETLLAIVSKFLDPASLDALADPEANLTVLVPPSDDLLKVVGGVEAGMLTIDDVQTVLKLHVIPEALDAMALMEADGDVVSTLLGDDDMLTVFADGDTIEIGANNTVIVTNGDLMTCKDSQVVHLIDGILVPEGFDVDLSMLPVGDLSSLEALAPAPAGTDVSQPPGERVLPPNGDETAASTGGAAGVAGGVAGVFFAVAAVLAF